MFVMLQRHRQGRLISVIVVSIGFLCSITGAMITSKSVLFLNYFFKNFILHVVSKEKKKLKPQQTTQTCNFFFLVIC